jgi:hypothetical protein
MLPSSHLLRVLSLKISILKLMLINHTTEGIEAEADEVEGEVVILEALSIHQ